MPCDGCFALMAAGEQRWLNADLFPTKWSFIVFVSYMVLFINQGILVTATQDAKNRYNYNTVTVVLLTECLKLVISTSVYLKDNYIFIHSFLSSDGERDVQKHERYVLNWSIGDRTVLLLYFVPSLLYCLYNNLTFVNLAAFDPTTYFLLLQFRVVVTGVIFQILFAKKLSVKQWMSLVLLTVGCVIKQLHTTANNNADNNNNVGSVFSFNLILILLQVFCSCFAGVYNEYLLKDAGADVHIMMQNVFMYCDSIVCNVGVLAFNGQLSTAFTGEAIKSLAQFKVVLIVFNSAGIGIATSLFLKNLNSILKTFASALELMFTAVLCWIIFGIAVDANTVAAIAIVSYATYLYSQNPVVNLAKNLSRDDDKEKEKAALTDGKLAQNV
uniref:Sugar phosphate transporter domain-containing protein n=1 Tax=Strigamia maritima TaxID=126957 RepID=T1JGU1_STRMM